MSQVTLSTQTGADLAGARIEQLTLLIGDRLGALHQVLLALEPEPIRICAISIVDGADHAVVRLVVDRSAVAARLLEEAGHVVHHRELLGVALPKPGEPEMGIRDVMQALLSAEVKVIYVYSLVTRVEQRTVLALSVEDMEMAERAILGVGLELVDQDQLGWGKDEA